MVHLREEFNTLNSTHPYSLTPSNEIRFALPRQKRTLPLLRRNVDASFLPHPFLNEMRESTS